MKNKLSITETSIFAPKGLLFVNGFGYNTLYQYQHLFNAKDHCFQNSKGFVKQNYNFSVPTKINIFQSTERQPYQHHNIMQPKERKTSQPLNQSYSERSFTQQALIITSAQYKNVLAKKFIKKATSVGHLEQVIKSLE